jgi:hypothetical protein
MAKMMYVYAGSGMLVRSIPYQTAPSAKQAAWLLHCAVLGAVIAPICLLGEYKSSPVLCSVRIRDVLSRIRFFSISDRGSASKNLRIVTQKFVSELRKNVLKSKCHLLIRYRYFVYFRKVFPDSTTPIVLLSNSQNK